MSVTFQSSNTPRTVQFTKYHFVQVIWFTSYSLVEGKLPCQILPSILIFSQDILQETRSDGDKEAQCWSCLGNPPSGFACPLLGGGCNLAQIVLEIKWLHTSTFTWCFKISLSTVDPAPVFNFLLQFSFIRCSSDHCFCHTQIIQNISVITSKKM